MRRGGAAIIAAGALAALGALGCEPDLVDDSALVTGPRVLAIAGAPAEAAPGTQVAFTALWVSPSGALPASQLAWAFCVAREPVSDSGPISPDCLDGDGSADIAFAAATGALPGSGCSLFGPDPPPAQPDQPAGRPVDPDDTGGFYQPVIVDDGASGSGGDDHDDDDDAALAEQRIRCGLPGATAQQASQYQMTYKDNIAPAITGATLARGSAQAPLVALETDATASVEITPGETVSLGVSWDVAESYVWFDPTARELTTRREAIRVSWFATGGSFGSTHTGRAEAEANDTTSSNTWTAPSGTAPTLMWIVVRDDRGGTSWASYRLAPGASGAGD